MHAVAVICCDGAKLQRDGSAASALAISASTRCSINLHRPSRRPTAAAVQFGPGRVLGGFDPYAPLPFVENQDGQFVLVEEETAAVNITPAASGRMVAFAARWACSRALTYILSHGADGLRQVSEDAGAQRELHPAQPSTTRSTQLFGPSGPCMHRGAVLPASLPASRRSDIAPDRRGFHPMTMYFPLVVHGAMLATDWRPSRRRHRPVHRRAPLGRRTRESRRSQLKTARRPPRAPATRDARGTEAGACLEGPRPLAQAAEGTCGSPKI